MDIKFDFDGKGSDHAKLLSQKIINPEDLAELMIMFTKLGTDLNFAMYISFIHLLFPINQFGEWFLISKTQRKASELGVNFFNELGLFLAVVYWIIDW